MPRVGGESAVIGNSRLSPATLLGGALALVAFAANSLLTRAALAGGAIDPLAFTVLRVASGAGVLSLTLKLSKSSGARFGGSWAGALFLVGYAGLFSWAYLALTAGTGALLLFGAVQTTMLVGARMRGERPGAVQWLGFSVAAGGLLWLLLPGASSPALLPALSMLGAGACWGLYSLRGLAGSDPLAATAGNFLRGSALVALLPLLAVHSLRFSPKGVLLAVISGGLTSGLGYALWYRVLPSLGSFRAAVGQLAVPTLAMLGGALLLSESLGARLLWAEALVLGGVALALRARR